MKAEMEDGAAVSMNRWICVFALKGSKKSAKLREMLGLEPFSLVTKKGRLGWFRQAEHKDDSDWIKCSTTIKLESGYARGIHGG